MRCDSLRKTIKEFKRTVHGRTVTSEANEIPIDGTLTVFPPRNVSNNKTKHRNRGRKRVIFGGKTSTDYTKTLNLEQRRQLTGHRQGNTSGWSDSSPMQGTQTTNRGIQIEYLKHGNPQKRGHKPTMFEGHRPVLSRILISVNWGPIYCMDSYQRRCWLFVKNGPRSVPTLCKCPGVSGMDLTTTVVWIGSGQYQDTLVS